MAHQYLFRAGFTSPMKQIHGFLQKNLKIEQGGARIQQIDSDTIVIWDCAAWGDAQTNKLKSKFPSCSVRCESSMNSLSGFIVILDKKWSSEVVRWYTLFLLTLTAIIVCMHVIVSKHSHGIM